jgi:hypothetical protein
VFAIGDPSSPLLIPYWISAFDELGWFLVDRKASSESVQDALLRDQILDLKRKECANLKAGSVSPTEITVDSPVPFSLRELWYNFDRNEKATYLDMARTQEALVQEGSASSLVSAQFKAPGPGNAAPFKASPPPIMASYVARLFARLKDPRFDFLVSPTGYDGIANDLDDLLRSWTDHGRPITVFDLAGVPFEIMDMVVGVIARAIFEGMFWGRNLSGIGRDRPILLVFEEAHAYLPKGGSAQFIQGYASRSVRRILREGRKYGIGAIVVSQRPSELDETILSQCGSFFALRLSNTHDQGTVRAAVPDALAGLMDLLPALRTGEALIAGEVVTVPSRVQLPLVEPRPSSNDPPVSDSWHKTVVQADYRETVTRWRRQRIQ